MHAVLVGAALFGEDAYEAELRAYVLEHGLADRVHFLGFQHDIAACMKAVDVVAHTSISPEPFGRVIIEGMLAKRPIVAARAGGVTDIVEDRENGILCTPGDVSALAGALRRAVSRCGFAQPAGRARLCERDQPLRDRTVCGKRPEDSLRCRREVALETQLVDHRERWLKAGLETKKPR